MRHLNEHELIDHYYGEAESSSTARHLRECNECAQAYAALSRDLAEVAPITPPARDANYATDVWNSIRASLPAYEPKRRKASWFGNNLWLALSYATASLVLIAAAFFAGRQWEHHKNPTSPTSVATADDSKAKERIVLLVLGDHLDRSERLLIELRHGSADSQVQAEARDLLSANRLYRESAAQVGDPALSSALDHLERVLIEIANQPDGVTPERLAELQKQMNTDGLLFEVRVLRSRMQEDEQKQTAGSKGVSI